jgi:hypothetical protein
MCNKISISFIWISLMTNNTKHVFGHLDIFVNFLFYILYFLKISFFALL